VKYHLAEDTINQQDIDRLISWLKTYPRLTKNQVTIEFEEKWSQWVGRDFSLHCNSGSSANLLMYYTLLLSGRLKNKKVIVPSVGWVTSIAPAIQFGFEPIMCEADPDTFGLDLNQLEILLQKHEPSTVLMVHVLGVPHKMDQVLQLKEKYGFFLLEDACAAIGATYKEKKVGAFGDMASFSFYFGHQMSTIEGGMVSTNDREFINLLRMLRSHGWSKDLDLETHQALVDKHQIDDFHSPFVFFVPGLNVRSTDLNAWIGIGQLEKLDWMTQRRQENHEQYRKLLGDRFYIQRCESHCQIASISFGLLADCTDQRRSIVSALVKKGIETRIFSAGNLGLHPFWYERYGKASFPVADRIHYCGLFLPNHPTLRESDVDFIARVVLDAAS
jgi:CDP-6-deoxy-D-xylo-4-hexulose-3-dehydrase